MKRIYLSIMSILLIMTLSTNTVFALSYNEMLYLQKTEKVNLYEDVSEDPLYWANEAIYYFKAMGFFYNTSNFYPEDNITYKEFKIFLKKLLNLKNTSLVSYEIIDKTFNEPKDTDFVTREQISYIVGNIIKKFNKDIKRINNIEINEPISKYAKNNFTLLVNLGVIIGDSSSSYNPKGYTTRAQLCSILYNFSSLYLI